VVLTSCNILFPLEGSSYHPLSCKVVAMDHSLRQPFPLGSNDRGAISAEPQFEAYSGHGTYDFQVYNSEFPSVHSYRASTSQRSVADTPHMQRRVMGPRRHLSGASRPPPEGPRPSSRRTGQVDVSLVPISQTVQSHQDQISNAIRARRERSILKELENELIKSGYTPMFKEDSNCYWYSEITEDGISTVKFHKRGSMYISGSASQHSWIVKNTVTPSILSPYRFTLCLKAGLDLALTNLCLFNLALTAEHLNSLLTMTPLTSLHLEEVTYSDSRDIAVVLSQLQSFLQLKSFTARGSMLGITQDSIGRFMRRMSLGTTLRYLQAENTSFGGIVDEITKYLDSGRVKQDLMPELVAQAGSASELRSWIIHYPSGRPI
jgi:hypothetical protein